MFMMFEYLDLLVIPFLIATTAKTGARSGANAFTTDAGEMITPSSWLWSDARRIVEGSVELNGNGSGGASGGGDDSGVCRSVDAGDGGFGGGPFRVLKDPGRCSVSDLARRFLGCGVGLADPSSPMSGLCFEKRIGVDPQNWSFFWVWVDDPAKRQNVFFLSSSASTFVNEIFGDCRLFDDWRLFRCRSDDCWLFNRTSDDCRLSFLLTTLSRNDDHLKKVKPNKDTMENK